MPVSDAVREMLTRPARHTDRRRTERRAPHATPRPAVEERRSGGGRRTGEDRVREAGGPQDLAFYRCACGYAFADDVSTSVACPKCGTGQSW